MEILVLGNGVSRLRFDELIRSWPGGIWGCNRVYREYGPLLSRIATDSIAMLNELRNYRAEAGLDFKLWAWGAVADAGADKRFTSPGHLRSTSGAMLVMQALEEGHTATLVGFDMGGPDVYSGDLGKKPNWFQKWRHLLAHYGTDRIRFIGKDWLPILSEQEAA